MTESRRPRLVPTGNCFCGCGGEAEIGRWFVAGHDITAAAALRAVQGESLPQRLVRAGYGPDRSVVQEAVEQAGWVRCAGCAYAGAPAGLAAHQRSGGCTGVPPEPRSDQDGTPTPDQDAPPAGPPPGERRPRRPGTAQDTGPVRAANGPAQGLLLPGSGDPFWKQVPLPLRHTLATAAYRLVTPEQPVLREKGNRGVRYALRAAGNKRMTGRHWHALLTAPRESFGSARSERADQVFTVLGEVVAQYVAPALAQRPADGTAGPAADPAPPSPG
ncbi:hypothetical protein [Streptomyces marianii]|uniref:Uncharacterized protein n=1 Tax=Streptomyces marianii TaxID=1817406 RepID=A0A5R9DSH3_9ACTN|nr:hypothetical protein [Streptomyces marianii]TLQ39190.1 hypothetical protein FEF34_37960 [Streptomyces marianii]TLQ39469.1 hypothetical protein FEF34_39595 [Streptomyces marianii]